MLSDSPHYEAFVAVVRTGSVTAAARSLKLPRPTVSRHLARLEADLGVPLLTRTTRKVSLTGAGRRLYERVGPLLDEWRVIEQGLRDEALDVKGTLRVSVLPLLAPALSATLRHLRATSPQLAVEVVANVRLVDLGAEGFDVAIWAGELEAPDLVQRKLTVGRVGLLASPAYLARRGAPATPDDLRAHELLRGHSRGGRPRDWWPLLSGGRVRVDGRFVTNDHSLLRAAALDGLGIALLAEVDCQEALETGRLVRVLPGVIGEDAVVRVVFAQRSARSPRVRAFVDALFTHFDVLSQLRPRS